MSLFHKYHFSRFHIQTVFVFLFLTSLCLIVSRYSTGNPTRCSVVTYVGRKSKKEGIYAYVWASLVGQLVKNLPAIGASLAAQMAKNLPALQETQVQSLGQEDSPGEGNGNSLQYFCLENSMDRGTWWAVVHGVTKN